MASSNSTVCMIIIMTVTMIETWLIMEDGDRDCKKSFRSLLRISCYLNCCCKIFRRWVLSNQVTSQSQLRNKQEKVRNASYVAQISNIYNYILKTNSVNPTRTVTVLHFKTIMIDKYMPIPSNTNTLVSTDYTFYLCHVAHIIGELCVCRYVFHGLCSFCCIIKLRSFPSFYTFPINFCS